MSLKRSEIRARTRVLLEEPTEKYWADATLNIYIHEGLIDFNRISQLLLEGPTGLDFVADQAVYSLAADCAGPHRILRLVNDEGEDINPLSVRGFHNTEDVNLREDGTDATPERWYPFGRQIGFWQVPEANAENAVYYWYLKTPADFANDDATSPFSDEEDQLIVYFTAAMAFAIKGIMQKARWWFGMWLNGVTEYASESAWPMQSEEKPVNSRMMGLFFGRK